MEKLLFEGNKYLVSTKISSYRTVTIYEKIVQNIENKAILILNAPIGEKGCKWSSYFGVVAL